ncbi:MAG: endonuclease/exonuclease/phosphatase family protein [Planctomycetes bacterium]|nr:endonuclease/exonuclease/phosphatase family protein [Planctomycetota bacterium]
MGTPSCLLALLALLGGAARGAQEPRRVPLKLLSYNLHGGQEATAAVMARFIAGVGADVVSLQEVPSAQYRDDLARLAGYPHVSLLDRGKALLSRLPLEGERVIPLVFDRSLVRATVAVEGIPVSLYGVHISWDVDGNKQARQIVDSVLPADPNPRKVLIGDFNDEHYSTQNTTLETVLADAWSDLGVRPGARTTWPATGFAGSEGHQLIDLLLYDPRGGMRPVSGEIPNLSPVLSDHRPVIFTMDLADPIAIDPPAGFEVDWLLGDMLLDVRFDREVDEASAGDAARYAVLDTAGRFGRAIEGVLVDPRRRRVRLTVAPLNPAMDYVLQVEGVRARAGTIGCPRLRRVLTYLPNLLANAGAEGGTSGWDVQGGLAALAELRQLRPYTGEAFFGGGATEPVSKASQTASLERSAPEIDAGRAVLVLGAHLATGYLSFPGGESRPEPYDDSELLVEVLDAGGSVLLETSSGKRDTLDWHPYREEVPLPPGSRAARVTIAAYRKTLLGGPQVDGAIDDAFAGLRVLSAPHGRKSGNLLRNGGAESGAIDPWEATPNVAVLANYAALSGSQVVAARGSWLFIARQRRDGGHLSQEVPLPSHGPGDYLRWGGWVRSWASRTTGVLRLEVLDAQGLVLVAASSWPRHEAEWTLVERFTPVPRGAARLRLALETQGADLAFLSDGLFACLEGGPEGAGWFARGDVERDGRLTVSDAIAVLRGLFAGAAVPCRDAADADDDGHLGVMDAVRLLGYLFLQGPSIPPPGLAAPGPDPTEDGLGC